MLSSMTAGVRVLCFPSSLVPCWRTPVLALLLVLCCSFLNHHVVYGQERFAVNFDPLNPYVEHVSATGHRHLQLGQPVCNVFGSGFRCVVSTTVRSVASDNSTQATTVKATMDCALNPIIGFNPQKSNCSYCGSTITTAEGVTSDCSCTICPSGYGNTPVAFDCDYPGAPANQSRFIVGTCSSFDCNFNCNGTCNFGCVEPIPNECLSLCKGNYPTLAPTGAVAPSGGNGVPTLGKTSAAFAATQVISSTVVAILLVGLAL